MDSLAKQEQEKYQKIWSYPGYGNYSPGVSMRHLFDHFLKEKKKPNDLLTDFGCGQGLSLGHYLPQNFQVQLVDITKEALSEETKTLLHLFPDTASFFEAPLWDLPEELKPSDWFLSTDVLEHLPRERLEDALESLASKSLKAGFFSISLLPDSYGTVIDTPLHLSLLTKEEWHALLSRYWKVSYDATAAASSVYLAFVEK